MPLGGYRSAGGTGK